jgi:hypothetical protein
MQQPHGLPVSITALQGLSTRASLPYKCCCCCVLQVALLEQESADLKDEDRQLSRLLADMAAQRDR